MGDDGRKLSYSERDKLNRERGSHGGGPRSGKARAADEERARQALVSAESLFAGDEGSDLGKELAKAVRAAHGTPDLAAACQAYVDELGAPSTPELASIFLDAGQKELGVLALDALLEKQAKGGLAIEGSLKRQLRILAEDFDDDLASRAEELLE
ncbi:MAG: hypothetical protein AB8G23_13925 [Myxococcota bacterium]